MEFPDNLSPEAFEVFDLVKRISEVIDDEDEKIALAALLTKAQTIIGERMGFEAGEQFQKATHRLIRRSIWETKFWNLMAEAYDKPIQFSRKKRAARAK